MACEPHPWNPDVGPCDVRRENHAECSGWDSRTQVYVDWDNPEYVAPKKIKGRAGGRMRTMARDVAPAPTTGPPTSGFPAGEEGSEKASRRWTDEEVALVDKAIRTVAERHRGGGEFTADEVWDELAGAVPVTKGFTARMMKASRAGLVQVTGKHTTSSRGGQHDHGQSLKVWYSMLPRV